MTRFQSAPSLLGSLLALLLLWPGSEARAQVGGPPTGGPPAPYAFLADQSDEVTIAMAQIWRAQFEVPASAEAANVAQQTRAEAEAIVRANSRKAAGYLMEALRSLSSSDAGGLTSLGPLLRLVGEQPEILAHFQLMLMQDAPPAGAAGAAGEAPIPAPRLFRTVALAQVVHTAREGSDQAQEQLLELLRSRDFSIRSGAVQGIYKTSPIRRDAQRAMRSRLDPEDHYLLYRH